MQRFNTGVDSRHKQGKIALNCGQIRCPPFIEIFVTSDNDEDSHGEGPHHL